MAFLRKSHLKKEILVVDDTPDNLRLLSAILTKRNYKVRKALTSEQAISSAKADAPDLILLDIVMSDRSGYETCAALKQDADTQAIPVIFISALDDALDKVKAFSVGGADYVCKPFQELEVLARIENQLNIRELQLQLEAQNRELLQSNKELEQFAHVVSHDLQQPLQSIIGYTKVINMQHSDLLNSEVQQYLNNILAASDRMRGLIRDLLSFAKVDQGRGNFVEVDCDAVLSEAISNLSILIQESQATVTHAELPRVLGKKAQLVQLFQNLLSNALKFSREGVPPKVVIEVSAESEDYWLLTFQDNGIGIPSEDISLIFQRFHRSHARKYSGNGIGLTICKKIVESHSGEIWVESVVDQGSCFFVRLPKKEYLSISV